MKQKLTFKKLPERDKIPEEEWFLVLGTDGKVSVAYWDKSGAVFWNTCSCNTGLRYEGVVGILGASDLVIGHEKDINCENCTQHPCFILMEAIDKKREELGLSDDDELDYKEVAELGLELSENCDHKI